MVFMRLAAGMKIKHADEAPAVDRNQIKGARIVECVLDDGAFLLDRQGPAWSDCVKHLFAQRIHVRSQFGGGV